MGGHATVCLLGSPARSVASSIASTSQPSSRWETLATGASTERGR